MKHLMAILLVGFNINTSQAEVKKELAQMFCGTPKEIQEFLPDYDKILEGEAGMAGAHGVGEVWLNVKTAEWFFIQRDDKHNVSCVVLGGAKFKHAVAGQGL